MILGNTGFQTNTSLVNIHRIWNVSLLVQLVIFPNQIDFLFHQAPFFSQKISLPNTKIEFCSQNFFSPSVVFSTFLISRSETD